MLDTMIYLALEHNQDVLIAMSRIEQAYAVLGVSKADLYPAALDMMSPDPMGNPIHCRDRN